MSKAVYDHPEYYEIAFSYRDIAAEVDTFEQCIRQYADRPVKRVLEIACGNSPHMEELLKRGYAYTGLDISEAMLAYSRAKAAALDGEASFIRADMADFSLGESYDSAFIALGSLVARNTEAIFSHFRSVGRALNSGGLYLLDWCVSFAPLSDHDESWTMERDGVKVTASFSEKFVDVVEQLVEETLDLEVEKSGEVLHLHDSGVKRVIFPQEFLQIVKNCGDFEFMGWWNNWNLDRPLGGIRDPEKIARPIVLLRRT